MRTLFNHRWVGNVAACALTVAAVWMASAPQLAAADSQSSHCPGGITYEGECTGDVLQWCENGEVIQIDCSEQGTVCAWSESKNFYTCMEANPVQNACELYGNLTWEGDCLDTHTLVWCSNGSIETLVCQEGMVCGWDASAHEYNCMGDSFAGDSSVPEEEASPGGGDEEETGAEQEDPSESLGEPTGNPSSREDADDIAEQAQVIHGNTPPSNGKEDDSRPSFFEAAEGAPEGGCTAVNPVAPGGFLLWMGVFLWFRARARVRS